MPETLVSVGLLYSPLVRTNVSRRFGWSAMTITRGILPEIPLRRSTSDFTFSSSCLYGSCSRSCTVFHQLLQLIGVPVLRWAVEELLQFIAQIRGQTRLRIWFLAVAKDRLFQRGQFSSCGGMLGHCGRQLSGLFGGGDFQNGRSLRIAAPPSTGV